MSRGRAPAVGLAGLGSLGFVWDILLAPLGDSLTWHMCTGEFTSAQEAEITDAANSWDAGSGEVLRGAIWQFLRGADRTGSSCNDSNFENEVYMEGDAWFSARGLSTSHSAVCLCYTAIDDIVFRSTPTIGTWSNNLPSNTTGVSIGQVAHHEFGHALGLAHEDDLVALMNSDYPHGGDLGDVGYRPHEDDYLGLKTNRPGSSTGRNLMLGKFLDEGDKSARMTWDNLSEFPGTPYCDKVISSGDRPEAILAVIEGTAAVSTDVKWGLSPDTNCDAGVKYSVAAMSITIGSNTPLAIQPTYDFTGVPIGVYYYLCAKIDPADTFSESSSASDNDVRSDMVLSVKDCP